MTEVKAQQQPQTNVKLVAPQTPAAPPTPEPVREPKPGDSVIFTGWNKGEENLHAVVAKVYGGMLKVNLVYLTQSGQWQAAGPVPHDPLAASGCTWRWGNGR